MSILGWRVSIHSLLVAFLTHVKDCHVWNSFQGDDPLGAIHLRGCVVTAVEDTPDGKQELIGTLLAHICISEVSFTYSMPGRKQSLTVLFIQNLIQNFKTIFKQLTRDDKEIHMDKGPQSLYNNTLNQWHH